MFWTIFTFELRKRLKSPFLYLMAILFAAFMFLFILLAGGAWEGASATTGDRTFANSAFTLHQLFGALYIFLMIVVAAVFGQAVFQDYNLKIYQLYFTKPITKTAYLGGRLAAAWTACMLIAVAMSPAAWLAGITPWVDPTLFGPHEAAYYFMPVLTMAAPNILFIGIFFFALATLTRRMFPVYMGAVVLIVGYLMSEMMLDSMDNRNLAAMLDPFGGYASSVIARYWSVLERNTQVIPLSGLMLYNRLLWLSLGAVVAVVTWRRFQFGHAGVSAGSKRDSESTPTANETVRLMPTIPDFSGTHLWASYFSLTRLQLRETLKNVYFMVIVTFGVLLMIGASLFTDNFMDTTAHPVTYQVLGYISGTFSIFMLILITFVSGELLWRERDNGIDQICDAMPVSDGVQLAAKVTTMLGMIALLMGIVGLTGVMIQIAQGYYNLEPTQYITRLFGIELYDYLLWAVIALFLHVIANHKFIGHGLMMLYYAVLFFLLGPMGLQHKLFSVGNMPNVTYSDMNQWGHYSAEYLRYAFTWGGFCLFLAAMARLFWARGKDTHWRKRFLLARQRFTPPVRILAVSGLVVFAGMAGFIIYNTTVLNTYRNSGDTEKLMADYEKTYGEARDWPEPSLRDVKTQVDIYPAERRLQAHGTYTLVNEQDQPIDRFLLQLNSVATLEQIQLDRPMEMKEHHEDYNQSLYVLPQPLQPGETMVLDFRVSLQRDGFPNNDNLTQVVFNGTFFDNTLLFPYLGYDVGKELDGERRRKKFGLPPKPGMPAIDDEKHHQITYIGSANRITFETTISTVPEQIAIAPGYLQKEWTEKGRRYFHYKMDKPIWDFYSFMSAEYEVKRDTWNDVNLEIYYHRGHEYNLDAMMDSLKASLTYFSENFSPYQHKQLRIIEFPRYRNFAQAFPNTVPFSESIGFIAKVNPDDEDDLDYPYYVTAHEVAHQWWAHQVCGAYVQGATLLSESLSQYSALMVMRDRFGEARMKRFLRYELDTYLMRRSTETRREMPLAFNENQQYIHYNKGSVVLFALQDAIGEDVVNQALARFLEKWAFKSAPYPTSLDLMAEIRAVAPEEHHQLIDDLFMRITLWDHRALEAEATPKADGESFEVTLKISAAKNHADDMGKQTEAPLGDWVDVGVFDEDEQPLYLAKHKIDQAEQTFTIEVKGKPARAGIDPLHKLIDREPSDNVIKVKMNP